jgi:hypothetical protein
MARPAVAVPLRGLAGAEALVVLGGASPRAGPVPSPVRRMGHARPPGLNWQKAATQTATLRGNPVEHGNIRAIESDGQARYCAIGLRYHDLRMRDHRGNTFDGAPASLSVGRKSWDREDTVKHTAEPRRRVSPHLFVPGCGPPRLNLVRSLVDTNCEPSSRRPQRR